MSQTSPSHTSYAGLFVAFALCAPGSSLLAQSSSLVDAVSPVNYFELDMAEMQDEAAPPASAGRSRNRRRSDSVTRAPAMMGDFFGGGIPFVTESGAIGYLPIGSRRSKIAENNKALSGDRVFFNYNHYANAASITNLVSPSGTVALDVNQYTFGAEKSFLDGLWSAELRMSCTSDLSFQPDPMERAFIDGGKVGNLNVNLKRSIYRTSTTSMVVGLGMTFPTGSDVAYSSPNSLDDIVRNEAVHLMPFFGFLRTPSDKFYFQFFAQVDIAANGNSFLPGGVPRESLNEANLLYLDFQTGYWLYQNPSRRYFPGMAAFAELHDTAVLRASDEVRFGTLFPDPPTVGSLLTFTVGLNLNVTEMTNLRVGGVFPLTKNHDPYFDGEFMVQLNRNF